MIPDPNFNWSGWSKNLAPVLGSMDDVIAIHNGRLISFDLVNENIRWQLEENFSGQPSVANGVIYSIASGALNARDQMTGALLWGWEPPTGNLKGTIIVTDSHLFVHTSSDVYAVDLVTHDQVWSYLAAGHLAISERTLLYIAGADGLLVAINTAPPEPVPDIKANGQDTALFILKDDSTEDLINITVALVPGYMEGRSCDWWGGVLTPFGTYWLNPQRN